MLYTKSVHEKSEEKDGIRICVMRYIKPEYSFDIWIPALAPSEELLKSYKKGEISWNGYTSQFKNILKNKENIIKALSKIALENDVTLLCSEKTPERCHRSIIAEECKKYNDEIEIVLK